MMWISQLVKPGDQWKKSEGLGVGYTNGGGKMKQAIIKNKIVTVDDEDLELLLKYNWGLDKSNHVQNKKQGVFCRLIMNCHDNQVVDHIDNNPLNCIKANLRITSNSANIQRGRPGTIRGVYRKGSACRWHVQIMCKGRLYYFGGFKTKEEAAMAYDIVAIELFGELAGLNFPENLAFYKEQLASIGEPYVQTTE